MSNLQIEEFICPYFYISQTRQQENAKMIYRMMDPKENVCRARIKWSNQLNRYALCVKSKVFFHADCLGSVIEFLNLLEGE